MKQANIGALPDMPAPALLPTLEPAPIDSRPRSMQTLRDAGLLFVAMGAANAANFAFHFGAIRLLGLQQYSAMGALLGVVLVFSVPANVLQSVVTALVGEMRGKRLSDTSGAARVISRVGLRAAILIIVLGAAVSPWLARFLALPNAEPAFFAFVVVAFGFAAAAFRGLLQGEEQFSKLAISLAIEGIGNLTFGLLLIRIIGGVAGAIVGNVVGILAALLFLLLVTRKNRAAAPLDFDLRRVISKGAGTALGLGSLAAMSYFDLVLVRHLMPGSQAGLYSALSVIGKVVLFSVAFIPLILISKASRMKAEGRSTRSLLTMMAAMGALLCAAEVIVTLTGPATILRAVAGNAAVPAAAYLPAYTAAIVGLALTTIIVNYGIGTHRFAFLLPLVTIELAEITGIMAYHGDLRSVITVILLGHWSAFVLTSVTTLFSKVRDFVEKIGPALSLIGI